MNENIARDQLVESQNQPEKPWLKIGLFASVGLFLAGGLVFAGMQIGKRQTQSQLPAQPTPIPRAIATPTPVAVVIPTQAVMVTPTPMLTPTFDPTTNWKTYTNTKYGYSIKYPLGAEVKEFGYPNKDMCFNITYKLTSITIVSPDAGGVGCIRTGIGYEGKEKEESIIVGDKEYTVRGVEEMGPGETLNFHNETLIVKGGLDGPKGRLGLEYGSVGEETSTYQNYLENKKYIYQILSTFRFLPSGNSGQEE
jgi:hypothetical protein